MEAKPLLKSLTLWFNAAVVILYQIANIVASAQDTQLPDYVIRWAVMIVALGNFVLRFKTETPLGFDFFSSSQVPKVAAAILCIGISSAAMAAPPEARITGPTAGVPGDLITLSGAESQGAKQFRWQVSRRDGGTAKYMTRSFSPATLDLNSYAGVYDVQLIVANDEGIDLAEWTVTIYATSPPSPKPPAPVPSPTPQPLPAPPGPGPDPTPPPSPTPAPVPPTPGPAPSFPAGKYQISQEVYQHALKVESPDLKADCNALAGALESTAAQISAGTLKGLLPIQQAYGEANTKAIGSNQEHWKGFASWLEGRISPLFPLKLRTEPDFATLMNEIALGLRAAGK